MGVLFLDAGELIMEIQRREIDPFTCYHEIVNAKLEGPPLVVIGERELRLLPAWAKAGDDLIEIGPYILRRTPDFHYARGGYYWTVVGHREWYWHYWRMRRGLDSLWRRLLLTLALWGLAEWPSAGNLPTWADVVRKWDKRKGSNG